MDLIWIVGKRAQQQRDMQKGDGSASKVCHTGKPEAQSIGLVITQGVSATNGTVRVDMNTNLTV